MARTKKTATKSANPVIIRNFDIPSLEKRVYNMDKSKMRNYDIFSLEKRIHDLETGGVSPSPVGSYTLEIGEAIEGTTVTLEKDASYLFSTVYNSGYFTNANLEGGTIGSVVTIDELGRALAIIRATGTSVSYSNGGVITPNKFVKFILKKNNEVVKSIEFADLTFSNGASISANVGEYYLVMTTSESNFTGADVIGHYSIGITTTATQSYIYVVKATAETISQGSNTLYYNKLRIGEVI